VAAAKKCWVAWASGACALLTSMTASTPARASSRPSPVSTSTPRAGDHDGVVSRPPQGLDGVATDDAGATDHGNAHRTPPSDNGETPVVSAFDRDDGDPPFRIEVQAPAVGLCELRIHARGFEKNVCPNSLRRAFNSPAEMPWRWV
jgi:hypothetical protein